MCFVINEIITSNNLSKDLVFWPIKASELMKPEPIFHLFNSSKVYANKKLPFSGTEWNNRNL